MSLLGSLLGLRFLGHYFAPGRFGALVFHVIFASPSLEIPSHATELSAKKVGHKRDQRQHRKHYRQERF
jgi:hypothetical protein